MLGEATSILPLRWQVAEYLLFLYFFLLLLQSCVRTQGTRIVRLTWVVAIPCVYSLGEFIHKKRVHPIDAANELLLEVKWAVEKRTTFRLM